MAPCLRSPLLLLLHPAPCLRPPLPLLLHPATLHRVCGPLFPFAPPHLSIPLPLHRCTPAPAPLHCFTPSPFHPSTLHLYSCTAAPCTSAPLHPAPLNSCTLHHCTIAPLHRCTVAPLQVRFRGASTAGSLSHILDVKMEFGDRGNSSVSPPPPPAPHAPPAPKYPLLQLSPPVSPAAPPSVVASSFLQQIGLNMTILEDPHGKNTTIRIWREGLPSQIRRLTPPFSCSPPQIRRPTPFPAGQPRPSPHLRV